MILKRRNRSINDTFKQWLENEEKLQKKFLRSQNGGTMIKIYETEMKQLNSSSTNQYRVKRVEIENMRFNH